MSSATGSLLSKSPEACPQPLGIDPQPLVVAPDALLKDVIHRMSQFSSDCTSTSPDKSSQLTQRHSYALVINNQKLLGILTKRDLVKLTAGGVGLAGKTALGVMNPYVVTLKASEINNAFTPLKLMQQYRISHLPIMTEQNEVYGVITATRLRQSLPAAAFLKRRQVKEVMATQIITAPPTTSVIEVAKLMTTHRVSCVVIQPSDLHLPLGIITEYDIIRIQRLELDLSTLMAETLMSSPLECVYPEDLLGDVQTKMQQLHVRRLVVINHQGHLAGLVTQTSILSVLDSQEMSSIEQLQDERVTLLQHHNQILETQMQSSETSLPACEEKLWETFGQTAVGMAHLDLDGTLISVNRRFADILGYQPAELLHHSFVEFTHPDDLKAGLDAMAALIQGTLSSFSQEKRYRRQDGSILWGNVTVSMATKPSSKPSYFIAVLEDISDRKQAETDLLQLNRDLAAEAAHNLSEFKASERRYQMLFESAPDLLFVLNMQGKIQTVNATVTKRLGYTNAELKGHLLSDLFALESPINDQQDFQRLLEQENHHQELELLSREGVPLFVDCVCSVISDTANQDPYILVMQRDISNHKYLESRLRSSEQQMRAVFEAMHDVVFTCTVQEGAITGINIAPTTPRHNIECADDLASQTLQYVWDNTQTVVEKMQQVIDTGETVQFEYSLTLCDQTLWFMANISPISDQTVLWVARDISDLKQAEQDLFQEKELAQVTLQSIGDAVITTDIHGNIYKFNPVAEHLTGWKTSETQGRPLSEVFDIVHEETRQPLENPIQRALIEERIVELADHTILIARDGTEYSIEDSAAPIRDRNSQIMGAVMVFRDVTHSRDLTRQLSWQASHDPLTHLANRRKFDQILHSARQKARDKHQNYALCFLDLDQFKVINDTCGHAAGDELLCQVSELLQKSIRTTDTLARLGGDEFAILLPQCSLAQAKVIAENLRQVIQNFRFSWPHKTFSIGVSIGLVALDQDNSKLDDIVGAADAACYAAKAKGRNRIQVYQDNDATLLQQRGDQQWSVRIRQALEDNRFCLYTQTIVPTTETPGQKTNTCEVLLRMIDKQNQVVSASTFITAAERYSLISEIDRWVISNFLNDYYPHEQACSEENPQPAQYMINLSGTSVSDQEFLHFLKQQLRQHPGSAQHICFEITETAAISNLSQAVHFIRELKKLGCRFALDDFGAGMSSFVHLKTLPVDYLKIDGHFIEDMADDPATCAIVESINHMGHVMGMETIAEFVSSDSIRKKLQDIGVDYIQGFTISRPQELPKFNRQEFQEDCKIISSLAILKSKDKLKKNKDKIS